MKCFSHFKRKGTKLTTLGQVWCGGMTLFYNMSFLSALPRQVLLNLILYGQAFKKKQLECFSIIKKKIKIKIKLKCLS